MTSERTIASDVLFGDTLSKAVPELHYKAPNGYFGGLDEKQQPVQVPFSETLLSKHIMALGGIGTGKTNAFMQIIRQLRDKLSANEVMVIFDTKGDFHKAFYQPGDVVISNDDMAAGSAGRDYWNIFNEIIGSEDKQYECVVELSKAIFAEACKKTNQVFFPNAARDLFMAILIHFIRSVEQDKRDNYHLVRYINSTPTAELRQMLLGYEDFRAMTSYISSDDSPQTQGVLSELQRVIRELFLGNFAKSGTLSMRDLIYQKKGKLIFIEYDLSIGKMLSPIYSLLFDQAIKEALCRERSEGSVYFVTDEFRLLPNLEHIDDAVNFGRSLGVKFMIGVQNVEQIYDSYGKERARSILSGFSTNITFRVMDAASKEYIKGVYGQNRKLDVYRPYVTVKAIDETQRDGFVVEDWDISNLKTGQAIIGLPGRQPFLFQFSEYAK